MRTIQERWNMFPFVMEESLLEQVANLTVSPYAGLAQTQKSVT